jgi:hypothetical protein
MKLVVFTIVKNGMPFIPTIFFNLQATHLDWRWIIAEGSSLNTHCTSWCRQQEPGLSCDGTTEFLDMISSHPRVTVLRKEMWDGKVEMCNACLALIKDPCVLMQMDADEIWRPDAIEKLVQAFSDDPMTAVCQVKCRYFLGVNIVATSRNGYGNNRGEWLRAWRFTPGDKFNRHEPPLLQQCARGHYLNPDWLAMDGVAFDHYAWWSENQAAYKEQFYGYAGALAHWRHLQSNLDWPVKDLRKFMPWAGDNSSADKLSC